MDRRTPYTLSVLPPSTDGAEESRTQIQAQLREFVLVFQLDDAFIYRYVSVEHKKKKKRAHIDTPFEQRPTATKCLRKAILLRH